MTLLQHIEDLVTGSSLNTRFQKLRYLITGLIALVIGLILLLNGIVSANNLNNSNMVIRSRNQQRILRIIQGRNPQSPVSEIINIQDYENQNQSDLKQKIEQEAVQANLIIFVLIVILSYLSLYYLLKPLSDNINQRENFVARASHELRTPLAILYSELSLGENLNDIKEVQQILTESKDEVLRLQKLANNLLDQDSNQIVSSNSQSESPTSQTNTQLINNIWDRLSKITPELSKLELVENDLNQQNWPLENTTQKNLIEELFWNILDNAIKHGDITQPVKIKVVDNQIVISNAIKIKSHNTDSKTHGLGICKDICEQLGWDFGTSTDGDLFVVEVKTIIKS